MRNSKFTSLHVSVLLAVHCLGLKALVLGGLCYLRELSSMREAAIHSVLHWVSFSTLSVYQSGPEGMKHKTDKYWLFWWEKNTPLITVNIWYIPCLSYIIFKKLELMKNSVCHLKYATMACWLFWIKITWETASARRTLWLSFVPWIQETNLPWYLLSGGILTTWWGIWVWEGCLNKPCYYFISLLPKPKPLCHVNSSQIYCFLVRQV